MLCPPRVGFSHDPSQPVRPITTIYSVIAAITGLLLAIAYAFLADFYDHSIRSIYQVERYLETKVLASIKQSGRRIILPQ